jgi:hypothetical protein
MTVDLAGCVDELRERGLLPHDLHCVFAAGSQVSGFGHKTSDLDLYVVSETSWSGPTAKRRAIGLEPNWIAIEEIFVGGTRWDIKYWTASQVEQMLAKVSWAHFTSGKTDDENLSLVELSTLERLTYAVAADGEEHLEQLRRRVGKSALTSTVVVRSLNYTDTYIEDAVGQLNAGDLYSAVLSARIAFGHAVDALLAYHGQLGQQPKWRARKLAAVRPEVLSFEEYWSTETMRDFDPDDPAAWIRRVVSICQRICMEVVIDDGSG